MANISGKIQEYLNKAQNYWQRANLHPSILQWRPEAIDAFGFYDGSGQWLDSDIKTVEARGQKPLILCRVWRSNHALEWLAKMILAILNLINWLKR